MLPIFLAAQVSVAFAASPDLSAVDGRYGIRAQESRIAFQVRSISGPGVSGNFGRFSGRIVIVGRDVSQSSVSITIVPDSVQARDRRVEAFLKSEAVFDAANENSITFRSTRVTRKGDASAVVEGVLTARGRQHAETFNVSLAGASGSTLRFHITGQVLRSRYGMDVGTPLYSNVVDFDMDVVAARG